MPEAKSGKNRLHLDLRTVDLAGEAGRVLALRARRLTSRSVTETGRLGKPDYRSSARNRLGSGGMMRPPAGCPAVARAGEMMAAC